MMRHVILSIAALLMLCVGCSRDKTQQRTDLRSEEDTSAYHIVYRSSDGRVLTLDDIMKQQGTSGSWEMDTQTPVSERAQRLHAEARAAGARGDYYRALSLLREAEKFAPAWPYPPYDAAFTYLLIGNDAKALEYYDRTLALAPGGFFTAIAASRALHDEARGIIPRGTYLRFLKLEWAPTLEARQAAAEELVNAVPGFAPAWLEVQKYRKELDVRLDAIMKGLALTPDAQTKGSLLIEQAIVFNLLGRSSEAKDLLGSVALDQSLPPDVVYRAKESLRMILEEQAFDE